MTHTAALLWGLTAGVLPVFAFLTGLALLDTFRLVRFRRVAEAVVWGGVAAVLCVCLSRWLFWNPGAEGDWYGMFGAPWVEEAAKAAGLVFLIRTERVAFMMDAAICGFAAGAGFALVENLVYLELLPGGGIPLFLLRGVGTAVMHGGATAIVGVVAIATGRSGRGRSLAMGLAAAIGIHTFWDMGILSPLQASLSVVVGLPPVFILIFQRSERALQMWMGQKLNQDVEILEMLDTGNFLETPAGEYLRSLNTFPPEVLGDMVCMLQISSELSAAAKGDRIRIWAGLPEAPDPQLDSKLEELEYLKRSIGLTGRHALAPLMPTSSRDRWELKSLQDSRRS